MTHVLDQQASQFPGLESQIHQIKLLYESKYVLFCFQHFFQFMDLCSKHSSGYGTNFLKLFFNTLKTPTLERVMP